MRNPFELMKGDYPPPGTLIQCGSSETYIRSQPMPRVKIVSGAPGVGKTRRLVEHCEEFISLYGNYLIVTSKTNFAVNRATSRLPNLEAETIYKLIWRKYSRRFYTEGSIPQELAPFHRGRKEYFRQAIQPGDRQLTKAYEMDAPSRAPKSEQVEARILSCWDPLKEPTPELLLDGSSLSNSCRFLCSMYLFCQWADKEWGHKIDRSRGTHGLILVDEAQDLLPLEATALGWVALFLGYSIVGYGDPLQAMDQDRKLPKLWEVADRTEPYFGVPEHRRVPLEIAKLAELILPGQTPLAAEWANCDTRGVIIPQSCDRSAKLDCGRGFNISESRYSVARCSERISGPFYFSPEGIPEGEESRSIVCGTPFTVKGYEHEIVTIQCWKPKHRKAYLEGNWQARKQLFVSVTRSKHKLVIHETMLAMIYEGATHTWP